MAEKLNDDFWDTFASAGIKLKQLKFGSRLIQLPLEAFDLSSNGLAALNSVCPDLKRLHLSLDMEPHIHSENSQTNADLKRLDRARYQLSHFLKSLKTLQEFSISLDIYWTTGCEKVVTDQLWPHLTVLILRNVEMIPEIFEKITARHGKTLRDIRLTSVALIDGSWADLFSWSARNLSIDRLSLQNLSTRPGTAHMLDFASIHQLEMPEMIEEVQLAMCLGEHEIMQISPHCNVLIARRVERVEMTGVEAGDPLRHWILPNNDESPF